MATLSASKNVKRQDGEIISYDVAESTKIYQGALVCDSGSGYAVPGADASGYTFLGVAYETIDNSSGSSGDKEIRILKTGTYEYAKLAAAGAAAQTDIGVRVYIEDDQTIAFTAQSANSIACGYVVGKVDASNLRIRIDLDAH